MRANRPCFLREMAMILIGLVAPLLGCQISEPLTVRVMTYNILVGGTRLGQPLEQTAAVIEAAEADIIGLQEQAHHADDLAAMLGFDHRVHGNSPAILSRWPIVDASPRGVVVALPNGRRVHVYNVHLTAYPYQPYDLRDQKIHTPAEAVAAARATRGAAVTALLEEIQPALDEAQPVFVTGDFNEPSHLDWIPATADAHLGYAVRWPTSRALTGVGLRDAYRAVHPDPASRPAPTWTPLRTAPANEVHDRIDWVLYAGQGVRVIDARVVGERAASADIVVQPFPSDHRAVVATFLVD